MLNLSSIRRTASRVDNLPLVGPLFRRGNKVSHEGLEGFYACQSLALRCAREVEGYLKEGWTERQAANLLDTCLRDHGVKAFFHKSFVWWGERTRFDGVRTYFDYLPSDRVLLPDEPYILDVAPILNGYIADIGYSGCFGSNAQWREGMRFLENLRSTLPEMFAAASSGSAVWDTIHAMIGEAGYENIHAKYPFSVLGHRVHRAIRNDLSLTFINFGWQSYFEFLTRGVFGQLLNQDFTGNLQGVWAIEPHIGAAGFGAKFEEILVCDEAGARWLAGDFNDAQGSLPAPKAV